MNQPTIPMRRTAWSQSDRFFSLSFSGGVMYDVLPAGVYNIQQGKEGLFLEKRPTSFVLPEKVYGMEEALIQRVVRTYANTKGNLGILLNGLRGTGKTVTAELLALSLNLPIILISQDLPGLIDFIDSIPHDTTYLCDEFEKVFLSAKGNELSAGGQHERGAAKLLPLMDGVMNGTHRKVFILTTNYLHVDQNLLQRPGRIRYLKTFTNLPRTTIEMIVDDRLDRKELRDALINYIARLEIITIDIVTSIVEEMNIHGGSPEALDEVFNVKRLQEKFDVRSVDQETMEESNPRFGCSVDPCPITEESIGSCLVVEGSSFGRISSVNGEYVKVEWWVELDSEGEGRHAPFLYRISPKPTYNSESFGRKYGATAM